MRLSFLKSEKREIKRKMLDSYIKPKKENKVCKLNMKKLFLFSLNLTLSDGNTTYSPNFSSMALFNKVAEF